MYELADLCEAYHWIICAAPNPIASRICQARGKSEFERTAVHETKGNLKIVIEISRDCKAQNKYPD
jgi:hypothetical protein